MYSVSGSMPMDNCIVTYCLFCNQAQFTLKGVKTTRNSRAWSEINPDANAECNFENRFGASACCRTVYSQPIGPFVFQGRFTSDIYV
jgi:hypothetical protein